MNPLFVSTMAAVLTVSAGRALGLVMHRRRELDPRITAAPRPSGRGRDRGVRVLCQFRGLYGGYPRQFRQYLATLSPDGLTLRPPLLARLGRPPVQFTERLLSVEQQPFAARQGAQRFGDALVRGQDGDSPMWVLHRCRTSRGIVEFAVFRPDVSLFLVWARILWQRPAGGDAG